MRKIECRHSIVAVLLGSLLLQGCQPKLHTLQEEFPLEGIMEVGAEQRSPFTSRVFVTSSGECVRFGQVDGYWQAKLYATPNAYAPQRTLQVVSSATIGPQLAWLQGQDARTSRARIHVLPTPQLPCQDCVYIGKLGLLGGMAGEGKDSKLPIEPSAKKQKNTQEDSESAPLAVDGTAWRSYDVFISHAGEDKEAIAKPLYTALTQRSIKTFFCEKELQAGEQMPSNMQSAIETSLFGIFILSPDLVAKKWPMKALHCFLKRQEAAKQQNSQSPNLIPVFYRLSRLECDKPDSLFTQHSEIFERHGFNARTHAGETNRKEVGDALRQLSEHASKEINAAAEAAQLVASIADQLCNKLKELRTLSTSTDLGGKLRSYYASSSYFTQIPLLFAESSKHISELACAPLHLIVPSGTPGQAPQKKLISHAALFSESAKVLVLGNPGTGKTTLSKQLAYHWSQGEWGNRFALVYGMHVKHLHQSKYDGSNYRKEKTLATAIVNNCFTTPQDEVAYRSLRQQVDITLSSSDTLVILDGLDERIGDRTEACETLIEQTKQREHALLMFSRAYDTAHEFTLAGVEKVELSGLSNAQVQTYIDENLDATQSKSLLSFFRQQTPSAIADIVRVPINLEILCCLWRDTTDRSIVFKSISQGNLPGLYKILTEKMWERYVSRSVAFSFRIEAREALFDILGQLAFASWTGEERQIPISTAQVDALMQEFSSKHADHLHVNMQDTGFLVLKYLSGNEQYEFPHLTLQEYFAGCWLAKQLFWNSAQSQEEYKTFFKDPENKYKDRYSTMFTFLAGSMVGNRTNKKRRREGICTLLKFTDKNAAEDDKKSIAHLRFQMRWINEWLRVSDKKEIEAVLPDLEQSFRLLDSLQEEFVTGIRFLQEYEFNDSIPDLTNMLVDFRSLAIQAAPRCLELLLGGCHSDNNAYTRNVCLSTIVRLIPLARAACLAQLQATADHVNVGVREAARHTISELVASLHIFGPAEWTEYFGVDVDAVPALPDNLDAILDSPCLFWIDKTVRETHLLFLLPAVVHEAPFTLDKFKRLFRKRFKNGKKGYRYYANRIQA